MKIETFKLENQGLDKHTIYYVKFTVGEKSYLMNIGLKSFEQLNDLNSLQSKLIEDEKQKGGKK